MYVCMYVEASVSKTSSTRATISIQYRFVIDGHTMHPMTYTIVV